jgi:anion-transporting  ArsA/GET3 family ATPase
MTPLRSSHKLVIVTGKGGVGRTLLAAALARLSCDAGLRTVLVTVDAGLDRHPLIDVPLRYQPAHTGLGFAVSRVDAFEAAAEYARRSLPFGMMYEAFFRSRAFRDFAAAAPGFEELMCLGKLYDLATGPHFDRVIFDAPATGHLRELLSVPAVTQRAVQVGPLNHSARRIEDLLRDPDRTHVLVATLAEEMPVREALELVAFCGNEMRMSVGPVLVNQVIASPASKQEIRQLRALGAQRELSASIRRAVEVAEGLAIQAAAQGDALAPLVAAGIDLVRVPRVVKGRHSAEGLLGAVGRSLAVVFDAPPQREYGVPEEGTAAASEARAAASGGAAAFVEELVDKRRVIVCCGSGGVGKTTGAAALAVLAARRGRKVLVMTIDPARRLAQALALQSLGHDPQRVAIDAPGELWAMMLDGKRAFDHLVDTYAPDERVREAIFANHYYQQLSSSLAGSRELVAMEQVLAAARDGRYDLLVVDTPPAQHALDFLDAPARLVGLLDGSLTGLLLRPYGLAARAQFNLFRQSSSMVLKFLERLAGVQMLAGLSDFLLAFSSMFAGFRERSHQVQALMREQSTAFLLVCSPEQESLDQVDRFADRLDRERMQIAGVLVNRVHGLPGGADPLAQPVRVLDLHDDERAAVGACEDGSALVPLPARLAEAWRDAVDLHLADQAALRRLGERGLPIRQLPRLPVDPHSLADLERLARLLLDESFRPDQGLNQGP